VDRTAGRHSAAPRPGRVPQRKITRSLDVDLRQLGGDELGDARITPDESLLAVAYVVYQGRRLWTASRPVEALTVAGGRPAT
jgi:hypothetical protein